MSALGHERTYAPQKATSALPRIAMRTPRKKVMSALHLKADICSAQAYVGFGPKARSCTAANSISIALPDGGIAPSAHPATTINSGQVSKPGKWAEALSLRTERDLLCDKQLWRSRTNA